jgi:hypothetical protein
MPDTIMLTLPSGHTEKITADEWRSIRGNGNRQLGTGNLKLGVKRCPCGAMTLARATARGHKCEAPTPKKKPAAATKKRR